MRGRIVPRGNGRSQSSPGFSRNRAASWKGATSGSQNCAARAYERAHLADRDFICCPAHAASEFRRVLSSDVSRSLAKAAPFAPSGGDGGLSCLDPPGACSTRFAPRRNRSRVLLPGNRTPGRPICTICKERRSRSESSAKHLREAIQSIRHLPACPAEGF